jgi:hypothetical protein
MNEPTGLARVVLIPVPSTYLSERLTPLSGGIRDGALSFAETASDPADDAPCCRDRTGRPRELVGIGRAQAGQSASSSTPTVERGHQSG